MFSPYSNQKSASFETSLATVFQPKHLQQPYTSKGVSFSCGNDTPFDFRKLSKIGERIDGKDEQLQFGRGYDHNWVLNKKDHSLTLAARVSEPVTGRIMEVWTTEPGLQFYSGNFLNGTDKGKGGKAYDFRTAFCLEAQHFPDSPNHRGFPTTVLKPGEKYEQKTMYKFSVMK